MNSTSHPASSPSPLIPGLPVRTEAAIADVRHENSGRRGGAVVVAGSYHEARQQGHKVAPSGRRNMEQRALVATDS